MFYNPAMVPDRDLNVAVLRGWRALGRPVASGWEMLAATGVRGLRAFAEAGPFDRFLLTEAHPVAGQVLAENASAFASVGVTTRTVDARRAAPSGPFDYVEVDPYGAPVPFVEAAESALAPEGLLGITATDTRVLAGVDRGAAERRYGGRPLRGRLGPEGGLRLLLAYLARRARSRGRVLVPRLAYVGSHHLRAYVTLEPGGGSEASDPIRTIDPDRWDGPPLPAGEPVGPMWLGPLFDPRLVERLVVPETASHPHLLGRWLDRLRAETAVDRPFYYEPNTLAKSLALPRPPSVEALSRGLSALGYRCAPTHARPGAFRTDAPYPHVVEVARALAAHSQNDRVRA